VNLKTLVIATQRTPLAARISAALADAGCCVATLTPRRHPARLLRKIQDHFAYRIGSRETSIVRTIDRWSPDFLVATDDLAVSALQGVHRRMAASEQSQQHIADLIELSLGPAASFQATHNKSDFLARVQSEGLRCPKTAIIPAGSMLRVVPADVSHPVVVKADHSYGGLCVRIADSDAAIRTAVWELQTPGTWHSRTRRLLGAIWGSEAFALLGPRLRRTVSLQQYIQGRPANRAVICWKGRVLAGISVEAVEVTHPHGPSSVVRPIDHPEMAMAAEHMVKCLDLSGFVGFDFVLDSSNQAWIIEMNPRVTPICHLSPADGTNLAQSLHRQLTGLPPLPAPVASDHDQPIALFPNEMVRCPSSPYIRSCQHDVPWDDPRLVQAVLNQALRTPIPARVRAFLERRLPRAAGAFVRSMPHGLHEAAPCRDGEAGQNG
jgi:glutathione synthase/RimK-type ligase-like ATP-grasp enzyme